MGLCILSLVALPLHVTHHTPPPPLANTAIAADAPVTTVAAAQQVAQSAERVQSAAKKVKQAADQVTQAANLVKLATDEALLALEDAVKILQMQVATQQGPMPPEVKAVVAQVRDGFFKSPRVCVCMYVCFMYLHLR